MTDEVKWKIAQKTKQNWEFGVYKNRKRGNKMIIKEFKDEFFSAYTLGTNVIGKHDNGWEIKAEIIEDYYEWVNYFEAKKGKMWVKGDFEDKVYASSKKAYEDFRKYFNPEVWDYMDI